MSNIISFNGVVTPDDDSLIMSNGGTDVFINVLALSGATIAQTDSEKQMTVFLSEQDQLALGGGCVGFDIVEMPWETETFEKDRDFILRMIQGARNKIGWELLNYTPNEEFVFCYLDTFEKLIRRMTVNDITIEPQYQWPLALDITSDFQRCKKHGTFLTCFGCQICNSTRLLD